MISDGVHGSQVCHRIVIAMSRCQFGLFEFDRSSGELRREGDEVKLPPQPTKVLTLLLDRPEKSSRASV